MPFDNKSAPQVVLSETVLAAIQQAVQQAVHQAMTTFAVPAVPQPIPQPTETQSISSQQVPTDPRIAREKLRKREQRKRKRSSARKATQTTERETASQPQQGTQVLVNTKELGTTTLYKASRHGTTATMETAWSTAGSLDHATQGKEVHIGMSLHGWMFRDSG